MTQAERESVRSLIWGTFAKQAAFIGALLFFLFFAFATYTYNPEDAGWFYSGNGGPITNSMGPVGAMLSDLLSAFFGSLFYSLPILFLVVAFIVWRNPHKMIPVNNAILCSIGSILYLATGSALCFLHTVGNVSLQFGAGGILVFILSIGFYITPALVGGTEGTMISNFIAYHISESLNWGLAAALGTLLLLVVLALYILYDKIVGIDNMKLG